jgi:hypothetical protein
VPVQKMGTEDFRLVQDLQAVNLATVTAPHGPESLHTLRPCAS